ncbi:MAG: glycosyltransferase [Flavobacterium sp.]|uniref:glycosyltransferase n=1 Tax=Flavobacterium sp. TaxID=239 RepID=UPI0022C9F29E|nr:glycosyltransferase [Flavobacterium sp.]MCZ8197456.1 glycosyltransferase [Flavobacterium sp.]
MNKTALLIPHYNEPDGLIKSLSSINCEENIDVFIIDDGSQKEKIREEETKQAFCANGEIFFEYIEQNVGLENALNVGLKNIISKGIYTYIARLDCGDLCIGKRFSIQEKFLNENPKIMLLSANVICVDLQGNFIYNLIFPENSKQIRKKMYLNSMFSHPCSMYRAEVIDKVGYYPTKYKVAEDYEFFFKIVKNYETANLQQYLLKYEINPNGISLSKRKIQVGGRIKIIMDNFYFGFWPIYGLVRNCILYFISHSFLLKIKKALKKA